MNKIRKNMILASLIAVQISFMGQPITAFAEGKSEHDKWITNQAMLTVMQEEKDQKQREWDALTEEQKYNKAYYEYTQNLTQYYEQVNILKQLETETPNEDIVSKIYVVKDSLGELRKKVLALTPDSNYMYSKSYLNDCISYLETALDKLNKYDTYYKVIDNPDQVKSSEKEMNDQISKFLDSFSKAYNYSVSTRKNDFKYDNSTKTDVEAYNMLKKYYPLYEEAYNNINSAYQSLKVGKYSNDLMQKIDKKIDPPTYSNTSKGDLNKYIQILYKVQDISDIQVRTASEIKLYSYSVLGGTKNNKDNVENLLGKFKTQLDALKEEYDNLAKQNTNEQPLISEKIDYVKLAELKEAEDNGYNSMEDYQAAIEKEQKSITKYKAADEKDNIDIEVGKIENQKKADIEKMQDLWPSEKIVFSQGQSDQNRDKAFYMDKADKNLKKLSILNDNTRSIILKNQSEAYDAIWNIINSGNANVQLMQNLYDLYPNDFVTILFYYKMK